VKIIVSLLAIMAALVPAAEKPNIVLIITDDQSWDSLAFMGGKVHTPRIDRMAGDGMFFSDFNVTSTVCSPSRYSFLTGRYAGRCEGEFFMKEHPPGDQTQVENIGELEPGGWNLARVLQQNGYRTGFVGKSHVVRHDWLKNRKASPLQTYPPKADPRDPVVNRKMHQNHQVWCDEIRKYGFDFADGVYAANLKELGSEQLNVHNLDWTVSKAFGFIEDKESEKPFFLYFSTTLHHGPAPWVNKFSLSADPRMTGEGFVKEGFDVLPARADVLKRNREAGFKDRDAYALWLDDGVGAILDKVASLGLEKETLIMFVPDHGSYRHGKATLHDFGMRVPLLMQWKGRIKPGTKHKSIIANIDIAPTLFDLCGITPPDDYKMDGRSFRPVLFGETFKEREVLFGELGHSRCVKTKDWKYIAVRYPGDVQRRIDAGKTFPAFNGEELARPYLTRNSHLGHFAAEVNPHYFEADQLYSLTSDPEEKTNVADNYLEIVKEMQGKLSVELKKFPNRPFGEFTQKN
jgi:arylsulfatase A-like enzyme